MVILFYPINIIKDGPIEVNIIQKSSKFIKNHKSSTFLPSRVKPLKTHKGDFGTKKTPKIDLKDYADHLKAIIDPVYYNKILPYLTQNNLHLRTICLLFVNERGMILSVKIIESSGRKDIDQVALDTFNQVKSLPKPPTLVLQKGIEWEFKF